MAEEETGFTFVDRRRTAPEAPADLIEPVEAAQFSQAQASETHEPHSAVETGTEEPMASEDEVRGEPAPSTYDLIGYCVNLLASQAWQKLGLLADPQTGEAQPDLADAKVAIDTLGDLTVRMESAPEGVLPAALRRDLRTLLNDLRLNYVSQRGSSE